MTDVEFIESRTWDYFPRSALAGSFKNSQFGMFSFNFKYFQCFQVLDIQGIWRTWYAGPSVCLESVKSALEYNNLLLRQMEEPVTRLGPGLKTTYSAEPEQNFLSYASQPRTRQEAVNRGYEKMS